MSLDYVIRRYLPGDLDDVRDLHDRSLRVLSGHLHPAESFDRMTTHKAGAAFARDLATIHFYVAVASHGLIGTAGWGEEDDPDLARIREVFVDPGATRRGVASALLRHVEADASAHGRTRLWLMSSLVAVPFYESHGYVGSQLEHTGTLPAITMFKGTDDEAGAR